MVETEPTIDLAKPTTIEEIKKNQEPKQKTTKKRMITINVEGVDVELDINQKLPDSFLESKLKAEQKYVPIIIYREIMREIGEFTCPMFSDPEKIIAGKGKSGNDMICYRVKCVVERTRPGEKKGVPLVGEGYHAMSGGILLSDAVHGNMATLRAKAMRDMLKFSYRIFEYPEGDMSSVGSPDDIVSLKELPKTAEQVIKETAEAMPGRDIEKEIQEEFATQVNALGVKAITENFDVTKAMILEIATDLKAKFGQETKPIIAKVITSALNSAS